MKQVNNPLAVVVPAAGVGKRMKTSCPKQYLKIAQSTILEHTVLKLLSHPRITQVIIALGEADEYFPDTQLANHTDVRIVTGGQERVDSVLAGLKAIDSSRFPWVLVHDAARPCVTLSDIEKLIDACLNAQQGGILALPVRDTMKRSEDSMVTETVERDNLWHALTPQMFPSELLIQAIEQAISSGAMITDEASAIEFAGGQCQLVEGSSENIKITRPDDLALAEFILTKQQSINDSSEQQEQI
ncbi:2-C-methyl-D-erythritol 4-phosphate cytidylyltransferase [Thalassotalea insulae]|uniref:2-C-methyl-D-erythritol 4-phosphate cytidylyltransferase n=1 Tax=Thalassotalea insulae TaxID=2056778 RepID=A0ABQ6GUP8_9GAMM|nr:2-C-methyl-D-erythritol 4-phosphate cytidylyltransferase [Thalassotalea insulae]GLX79665.1 2-C-methyl-D-erythritol 4-phosphate cytidylyltransferase [Thalassotalea insulae]